MSDQAVAELTGLIRELPPELRRQALTHSSWGPEPSDSYERLAFLGDSVLGLAVAAEISDRYPTLGAGELTKILNQSVSGVSCSAVGTDLGVPEMMREAEPEQELAAIPAEILLAGGRPLPEVTEALIGACFVAFGFERTQTAAAGAFESRIELATKTRIDFKSALQELLARRGSVVTYEVVGEEGPPHDRIFEVAAMVDDAEAGRGSGRSKKAAEQVAAERALEDLGA